MITNSILGEFTSIMAGLVSRLYKAIANLRKCTQVATIYKYKTFPQASLSWVCHYTVCFTLGSFSLGWLYLQNTSGLLVILLCQLLYKQFELDLEFSILLSNAATDRPNLYSRLSQCTHMHMHTGIYKGIVKSKALYSCRYKVFDVPEHQCVCHPINKSTWQSQRSTFKLK